MSHRHEESLATRLERYFKHIDGSEIPAILRHESLPQIEAAFLVLSANTKFNELTRIYGWNVEEILRFLIEERVWKEEDIEQAKKALALVFHLLSTPGVAPDEPIDDGPIYWGHFVSALTPPSVASCLPTEKGPEQWKNIKYSTFILVELDRFFRLDPARKEALYPTFLEGFVTALEQGDNTIKEYLTHYLERKPVTGCNELSARLSSHATLKQRAQKALNDYKALHLPGSFTESGADFVF